MSTILKRSFLFFFLSSFFFVMIFPDKVLLNLLEWKIKKICKSSFNAEVSFQKVDWKNGKVLFHEVHLNKKEELEAYFSAEWKPSFNFFKIGGNVKLEKLQIIARHSPLSHFTKASSNLRSFIPYDFKITVCDGQLLLYDYKQTSPFFQKLAFDSTFFFSNSKYCGQISFPRNSKGSHLFLSSCKKITKFSGHLFEHQAEKIHGFFNFAFPENSLKSWEILNGLVDGRIESTFFEKDPFFLKGDFFLSGVAAKNEGLNILAELEELSFSAELDFSKSEGLNGQIELSDSRLAFLDKPDYCPGKWDLKQLHAELEIENSKIKNSAAYAHFLGIQGQILLDWQSDVLIRLGCCGKASELTALLPTEMQSYFKNAVNEDSFILDADLKNKKEGIALDGFLTILDPKDTSRLDFTMLFERQLPEKKLSSLQSSLENLLFRMKQQFCLSSNISGSFNGRDLPLEKILSPFVFEKLKMKMRGNADIEGSFQNGILSVDYKPTSLHLESPFFLLNAEQGAEQFEKSAYFINCKTGSHYGNLSLRGASYFQKNYNLYFDNIDANFTFNNEKIDIQEIVAHWEQIKFLGEIKLQVNHVDDIDMQLICSDFSSDIVTARHLLKHFVPSSIWNLPLDEGTVFGSLFFDYHFANRALLKKGSIGGKIENVSYSPGLFTLNARSSEFLYDYNQNSLTFFNGKGDLSLASSMREDDKEAEILLLDIKELSFRDFPFFQVTTDFRLDKVSKEGIQLKGATLQNLLGREIHLEGENFKLLGQLENGRLSMHCQCNQWQAETEIQFQDKISIDRFLLTRESEKIPERPDFICDFFATYDAEEKTCEGKITQLAGDLSQISQIFSNNLNNLSVWSPEGNFSSTGTFSWNPKESLSIATYASFQELEFGGIHFGKGKNLFCQYGSKEGLVIEGLEAKIASEGNVEKYKLGKFHYDFFTKKILFEGFDFSVPSEKLPKIVQKAELLFPGKVHPALLDGIEALKKNALLEGNVSIELYPENLWIYLKLKDGVYSFADKELNLENFFLIYDPLELNIWTKFFFRNNSYWAHFAADSQSCSKGIFSISEKELSFKKIANEEILTFFWKWPKKSAWQIEKVEGIFSGIEASLSSIEKEADSLREKFTGQVSIDPQKARFLLDENVAKWISQYSLAGEYHFDGQMSVLKEDFTDFDCEGTVVGRNVGCKQVQFSTLLAKMTYSKEHLKLFNLNVQDISGKLNLNQAILQKQQDKWFLDFENLNFENFRLSRLTGPFEKNSRGSKPFLRTLTIPSFSLNNFNACLTDLESYRGAGSLKFTNLPKKNLFTSLLFLPTEITARIGLDLTTWIPAYGTVLYEIRNGKIQLLEFKNMFSDARRSRFYLAEHSSAYIDFKGNLNVKIKMKQYNLLMKLAEFFTLSVRGTIFKPKLTLSNHIEDEL